MKRILTMALCIVLTAVIAIGGTLAYMQAYTDTFKNTFTYGNITLDFIDSMKLNYSKDSSGFWNKSDAVKMKNQTFSINPILEVGAGSDECYVYMMIKKSAQFDTYIKSPDVTNSWQLLTSTTEYSIYYTEIDASSSIVALQTPAFYASALFTSNDYNQAPANGTVHIEHLGFAVQKAGFTGGAREAWIEAFGARYPVQ